MPINVELLALSPRCCVVCDYSLEGLAAPARCPECGQRESLDIVTLRGWNESAPRLTHWLDWLSSVLTGGPLMVCGLLISLRSRDAMGWALVVIGIAAITLRWIRRAGRQAWLGLTEPPLRCFLSPLGFSIGLGKRRRGWRAWEPGWLVTHSGPSFRRRCWLTIKPKTRAFTVSSVQPVLRFDFDATAEQITALHRQIEVWIGGSRVGHGFEVVPLA